MKKNMIKILLFTHLAVVFFAAQTGFCEPSISEYTCYPIFQENAVEPNIMVILDNSGSMNFYAYGTWPGDGGIARDAPYAGEPYQGRTGILVNESSDDAYEQLSTGNTNIDNILVSAVYDGD